MALCYFGRILLSSTFIERSIVNIFFRTLLAVGVVLSIATIAGCGGGSSSPADFSLVQDETHVAAVDLVPKVADENHAAVNTADMLVGDAQLTKDGARFGEVFIVQIVVAEPNPWAPKRTEDVRRTELNFELPDGQIMVQGTSTYSNGDWRLTVGKPVVRPIVGGTGAYAGARGEHTGTRQADGTYEHLFHFVD